MGNRCERGKLVSTNWNVELQFGASEPLSLSLTRTWGTPCCPRLQSLTSEVRLSPDSTFRSRPTLPPDLGGVQTNLQIRNSTLDT